MIVQMTSLPAAEQPRHLVSQHVLSALKTACCSLNAEFDPTLLQRHPQLS